MELLRAVVENNNDPLKSARVQVRIFGLHTSNNEHSDEKFNLINSSELPWAETMGGTDFGLLGGVGLSTVLKQGTWVWIVLDHNDPNKPVVVGTIKGTVKTRTKYKAGEGFNDKDEVYPYDARVDETDLSRLSTVTKLNDLSYDTNRINGSKSTAHKYINDNLDTPTVTDGVSGADASQTEPNSLNDLSTYPNVSVLETPSGHVLEFDDTPSNERIRLYHASGSYIEIRPDGTFIQKSGSRTGESHYIHMSDVQEHIAKGVKRYIENNLEEIIKGGIKQHIDMDSFNHVGGFFKITADGNLEIVGDVKITGSLESSGTGTFSTVTSKGEVADSSGNLSALRGEYDKHTHIGNLGIPTAATSDISHSARAGDFAWSSTPKGFK